MRSGGWKKIEKVISPGDIYLGHESKYNSGLILSLKSKKCYIIEGQQESWHSSAMRFWLLSFGISEKSLTRQLFFKSLYHLYKE